MPVWQAIVLGIVQGLGEFLPISSSAHLILVPWLFGWEDPGLAFDVALHWGTLFAVLLVFWRDWLELIQAGAKSVLERRIVGDPKRQLFWALVIATIPGAIIGKLLAHRAEEELRAPLLIAATLTIVGAILWWCDKRGRKVRAIEEMGFGEAAIIGLAQACALVPGVSRSGSTMSVALWAGYTRDAAARFSFLLSTPIIFGAGLMKLPALIHALKGHPVAGDPQLSVAALLSGMAAAAIVGTIVIRWLLAYLRGHSVAVFSIYRAAVSVGIVVLWFLGKR
ncbi:MAG: UDP-diphosphatase [Deltaproteobacteria bacterium]|nr:UDP-diphosphatase [Deltaproteobacteria bacterium]